MIEMTGRIFQLNVSPGGVPKFAVREATVNELGMSGDDHRFPTIHGGPERALLFPEAQPQETRGKSAGR